MIVCVGIIAGRTLSHLGAFFVFCNAEATSSSAVHYKRSVEAQRYESL